VVGRDVKLFSHEEVSVIDVSGELEHLSNEGLLDIKAAHGSCEQQGEAGVYILENAPPPRGEKISADIIWGKKYEKGKRKRGKM
jgi:hypothetical protein